MVVRWRSLVSGELLLKLAFGSFGAIVAVISTRRLGPVQTGRDFFSVAAQSFALWRLYQALGISVSWWLWVLVAICGLVVGFVYHELVKEGREGEPYSRRPSIAVLTYGAAMIVAPLSHTLDSSLLAKATVLAAAAALAWTSGDAYARWDIIDQEDYPKERWPEFDPVLAGLGIMLIAFVGLVGVTFRPTPAFAQEDIPSIPQAELCELLGGGQPTLLRDFWNACANPGTGDALVDLTHPSSAADETLTYDNAGRGEGCTKGNSIDETCWEGEEVSQVAIGDEGVLSRWVPETDRAEGFVLSFRRDRFVAIIGEVGGASGPRTQSSVTAAAIELDGRLVDWLKSDGSVISTRTEGASDSESGGTDDSGSTENETGANSGTSDDTTGLANDPDEVTEDEANDAATSSAIAPLFALLPAAGMPFQGAQRPGQNSQTRTPGRREDENLEGQDPPPDPTINPDEQTDAPPEPSQPEPPTDPQGWWEDPIDPDQRLESSESVGTTPDDEDNSAAEEALATALAGLAAAAEVGIIPMPRAGEAIDALLNVAEPVDEDLPQTDDDLGGGTSEPPKSAPDDISENPDPTSPEAQAAESKPDSSPLGTGPIEPAAADDRTAPLGTSPGPTPEVPNSPGPPDGTVTDDGDARQADPEAPRLPCETSRDSFRDFRQKTRIAQTELSAAADYYDLVREEWLSDWFKNDVDIIVSFGFAAGSFGAEVIKQGAGQVLSAVLSSDVSPVPVEFSLGDRDLYEALPTVFAKATTEQRLLREFARAAIKSGFKEGLVGSAPTEDALADSAVDGIGLSMIPAGLTKGTLIEWLASSKAAALLARDVAANPGLSAAARQARLVGYGAEARAVFGNAFKVFSLLKVLPKVYAAKQSRDRLSGLIAEASAELRLAELNRDELGSQLRGFEQNLRECLELNGMA